MSHLPIAKTASLAGISSRQLQRLLIAGKGPTAERSASGRWVVPDSAATRQWCKTFKKWGGLPTPPKRQPAKKPLPVVLRKVDSLTDAVCELRKAQAQAREVLQRIHDESLRVGIALEIAAQSKRGRKWWELLSDLGLDRDEARDLKVYARAEKKPFTYNRAFIRGIYHMKKVATTPRGWVGAKLKQERVERLKASRSAVY